MSDIRKEQIDYDDDIAINGSLSVDNLKLDGNTFSSENTDGNIILSPDGTGEVSVSTSLIVDNLKLDGNTLSSTDTNGNILLSPDGSGAIGNVLNTSTTYQLFLANVPSVSELEDQTQTASDTFTQSSSVEMWQSFTPANTGLLTSVAPFISSFVGGTPTSAVVRVYLGQGLGGTLLVSETIVPAGAPDYIKTTFTTPVLVQGSTEYTFSIQQTGGTGQLRWDYQNSNIYAGGVFFLGAGTADGKFKTWIDFDTGLTLLRSNGFFGINTQTPTTLLDITGDLNVVGEATIDNININGNTIVSLDTNGDINLTPDGVGMINLNGAIVADDISTFQDEMFLTAGTIKQPYMNLLNTTAEDLEGGRESRFNFKGTQSGAEISTLARIQASHDGTADDQKGDLIFHTNDGADGSNPTEQMRIDSAGQITAPNQPFFRAFIASPPANVTGDATTYTMIYSTEVIDRGADYNNTTGIFTAPIDGLYLFTASVRASGYTSSHVRQWIRLTTSNADYFSEEMNPFVIRQTVGTDTVTSSISKYVDMDAADTAQIDFQVSGGTLVVDIEGTIDAYNHFTGGLIC